jgi:hypothetical protein
VILTVAILVISIELFFSSYLAGVILLLIGILAVGKKCAYKYTHIYIHTAACFLKSRQQYLFDIYLLLYVVLKS